MKYYSLAITYKISDLSLELSTDKQYSASRIMIYFLLEIEQNNKYISKKIMNLNNQ